MSATNTQITVEAAVLVNGNWIELTKHITKFSHHLSNVQASNASITLNSEHMNYKLDDFDYLKNGQTIVFRYGYLNSNTGNAPAMSRRYKAIIGDINYQYGSEGSKFILKLISKGYFMKKVVIQQIWKNVTASEIANKIAEIHGLKPVIDASTFRYQSLPQGISNNYEFLKRLALLEDGFVFFVRSNELHFKKVGTHTPPIYKLDVRGKIVKDLSLTWQEIEESKKMGTLFSDGDGFSSRETIKTMAKVGEGLLATVQGVLIDSDGNFLGGIMSKGTDKNTDNAPISNKEKTAKGAFETIKDATLDFVDDGINGIIDVGEKVVGQVENVAQKELGFLSDALKSKRKELTGNITIVGVPYLINDKTMYIENIHSRFTGIYYIEEVSHRIEESYTTTIKINRHGIRRLDEQNPDKFSITATRENSPYEEAVKQNVTTDDGLVGALIGTDGQFLGGVQQNTKVEEINETNLNNSEK